MVTERALIEPGLSTVLAASLIEGSFVSRDPMTRACEGRTG